MLIKYFRGILVLKYAMILQDKIMFQVNVVAIFLNILYTLWYSYYSSDKWSEVFKQLMYGIALVVGIFAYIQMESTDKLEFRYGLLITILSLILLAFPLLEIVSKRVYNILQLTIIICSNK